MNLSEHIKAYEKERNEAKARIASLIEKSLEEGRTLDEVESKEHDDLEATIKSLDKHIERLHKQMQAAAESATPVDTKSFGDRPVAGKSVVVSVNKAAEEQFEGQNIARLAIVKAFAHMKQVSVDAAANHLYGKQWLQAVKSTATVSDTDNLGTLVGPSWQGDFIDYLRPMTVYGQLSHLFRAAPANIPIKGQSSGASAYYVGELERIPVTNITANSVTLTLKKAAAIATFSSELLQQTGYDVERMVRDDIAAAITQLQDSTFLSTNAGSDSTPAGIRNGISKLDIVFGMGSPEDKVINTAAKVRTFVGEVANEYSQAHNLGGVYFAMNEGDKIKLSLLRTPLGVVEFPGLQGANPTIEGFPVVVSNNVPPGMVIAIKPSDIYAINPMSGGGLDVSISRDATIAFNGSPELYDTNLWQQDMIGVRLVLPHNWALRRSSGVVVWTDALDF